MPPNTNLRPQVSGLLEIARQRGAIIYYDVNFRPAHQNDVMKITPNLIDNLEYADIVRGSREDFTILYKNTCNNCDYFFFHFVCDIILFICKCPKIGSLSSRCLIDSQFAKCPNLGKWLIIMFFNTLYARGEA